MTTARGRCWTPTGSLSGRIPRTSTAGPISFRSDSVGVFERILLVGILDVVELFDYSVFYEVRLLDIGSPNFFSYWNFPV